MMMRMLSRKIASPKLRAKQTARTRRPRLSPNGKVAKKAPSRSAAGGAGVDAGADGAAGVTGKINRKAYLLLERMAKLATVNNLTRVARQNAKRNQLRSR
jgi:hypothetical protein